MPRKSLIRSCRHPYHVVARCNNREEFPLEKMELWRIFQLQCAQISMLFGAQIHALVVMPNHFHMLISTPEHDLGTVMQYFMRSITRAVNLKSGRSGRIFGGRYHWSFIDSEAYFYAAFKYVYRNPIRAGLCATVEEYPFSSLNGLIGSEHLLFPIYFPFQTRKLLGSLTTYSSLLRWLNTPSPKEIEERVRKALQKTQFQLPPETWRRSQLDSQSLLELTH